MKLRGVTERFRQYRSIHKPPRCPEHWSTGAPDYIGLGAQRAGTTWWNHLIESHPAASPQPFKELHYLRSYWNRPFTDADVDKYHSYFPRPSGSITGEFSPGYLSHFWIPPLLNIAAADARFIILLRNPVDRYQSGLELQSETRRLNYKSSSQAFRLGCYALQLENLFKYIPPERVQVLQFEKCLREPASQIAASYEFLGLDSSFIPVDLKTARNSNRGEQANMSAEDRANLVGAYEAEVLRTKELVPSLDMSLWSDFTHLV